MNKKTSYISAGAFAVGITAGVAGWLALDANEPPAQSAAANQAGSVAPGVSETEAVLIAPAESSAAQESNPVPVEPEPTAAREPEAPSPIGGRVPAVRATRAPVSAPSRATRAERANREPANREPVHREPVNANPRTEPVEPVERVEPVEPQVPQFIEVIVPRNAVLGVRLNTSLSSDTAEVEDRVEATVTRDVIAGGRLAIPAGTRVLGSVNEVTRGGKFKERARLSVRFHTLVLADGTREPVRVGAIVREGDSPARESAAKIGGGAVGGAIIGGILGGRKGAILGGAAGAGAGTAAVAAGDRSVAALPAGSPLSVQLEAPVTITRER